MPSPWPVRCAERYAGEIGEAGRGIEIDGLDARVPHQGLQLGDTALQFLDGDRCNGGRDRRRISKN